MKAIIGNKNLMNQLSKIRPFKNCILLESSCENLTEIIKTGNIDLIIVLPETKCRLSKDIYKSNIAIYQLTFAKWPNIKGKDLIKWHLIDKLDKISPTLYDRKTKEIIFQKDIIIDSEDNIKSLTEKINNILSLFLVDIDKYFYNFGILSKKPSFDNIHIYKKIQDRDKDHEELLKKEELAVFDIKNNISNDINWRNSLDFVKSQIEALYVTKDKYTGKEGAKTSINGVDLVIWKCEDCDIINNKQPGEIIRCDKTGTYVSIDNKVLKLTEIQFLGNNQNKRIIPRFNDKYSFK